jgi:hypothetical protein
MKTYVIKYRNSSGDLGNYTELLRSRLAFGMARDLKQVFDQVYLFIYADKKVSAREIK